MDWLIDPIPPMLATLVQKIPGENYVYEVKWDGIRAIITVNDGEVTIRSRNKNDITAQFPELQNGQAFGVENGVFDGEIVCMDERGKPSFKRVIKRLKSTSSSTIQRLVKTHPVQCYVFDCLYLDGLLITNEPLHFRYSQVVEVLKPGAAYRISEWVEDGEALFQAIHEHGMEGIMAKRKDGRYLIGKRSMNWQKIKIRKTADCFVIGFTKGKGDRAAYFGALHVAEPTEKGLVYRGKVGTGFTVSSMKEIFGELKGLERLERPDYAPSEKGTIWIRPERIAEISYSSLTPANVFRDPVFHRMRPELSE